jgi:hypothetical protein
MNSLAQLTSMLGSAGRGGDRPMPVAGDIDRVLESLQRSARLGSGNHVPQDLQMQAVQAFWQTRRVETLRDAQLVSFGMCLPHRPDGPSVMEDTLRFGALLDGIDQWLDEPRCFRRCYQGLLRSYFGYDAHAPGTPPGARRNWGRLRDYLRERAPQIADQGEDRCADPAWVTTVLDGRTLFTDTPCAPYAEALLRGDTSAVDALCERLGIGQASWFLRELVQAQLKASTSLGDEEFCAVMPALLEVLRHNRVLRDLGLALLLDRYVKVPNAPPHAALRDAAALWWGSPWLPSNAMRWSGATEAGRAMVTEWLKSELIEAFFSRLAEDGAGQPRRARFWQRYLKSIESIHLALGPQTPEANNQDTAVMLNRIDGLCVDLRDPVGSNQALVLTLGTVVVVEFSHLCDAMYAYDTRHALPFDLARPVRAVVDADNSLRSSRRAVCLPHQDGVHGWGRWETRFEATLSRQFDVAPGAPAPARQNTFVDLSDGSEVSEEWPHESVAKIDDWARLPAGLGEDVHWNTAEAALVPYSRADLEVLARVHAIGLDDRTAKGGRLWVHATAADARIGHVLSRWGFVYEPGHGWWK